MPNQSDPPELADRVPVLHAARKARTERIFRGAAAGMLAPVILSDVLVWPFGPKLPPDLAALALDSGNARPEGGTGRALRRLFLQWQYNWCRRYLRDRAEGVLLVWNGVKGHRRLLAAAAQERGLPVVYFEEGPLPGRLSVDFQGVNYGCSLPRRIDFYHAWARDSGVAPEAWRAQKTRLTARAATRADVAQGAAPADLAREPFLFCPLQVPGDSQLTIYGGWIRSVEATIEALARAAEALPEGWHLRVKEHPSARVSFAGRLAALASPRLRVDNTTDTFAQVAASRGVVTVNSSVGLQAMFFDKPVLTLGQAFYALEGVAHAVPGPEDLARLLADPAALGFDPAARGAFLSYLDAVHFPEETAVRAGRYALRDVVARDRRRDAILAGLARGQGQAA